MCIACFSKSSVVDVLAWIEAHPGLASWIQAIGTLAAIAFAVWLPTRERRAAQQTAEVAARTPIMAALVASTEVWNFVRSETATLEARERIGANLHAAHERLNNFALHTLSAPVAVAFQEVRDAFLMLENGFNDSKMRALGNIKLRGEFLQRVQALSDQAPRLLGDNIKAAMARAIRETTAETSAREKRNEKEDDHG
jgi:hypothetical protein